MREKKTRYDLDNIPISDHTKKGLTSDNIYYIGAIGRMLSIQDEVIAEIIDAQTEKFELRFNGIDKRLDLIEMNLSDKEKRLVYLEHYASWGHTVIRHLIAIIVGVLIGWGLHSIITQL